MPKNPAIGSVLIIGSGPIIIGQACEFDYAGSQAARSLREEGIKVILINSNPATIMTDPMMADRVYLLPLTVESIEQILEENQIDAVLPTMGGQTALNLCKEAAELGVWEKYNVKLIGVDIDAIDTAEDREKFKQLMIRIGIDVAPSRVANSMLEGKEFAQDIGFPLVIRPSFTLGGTGGGFVHSKDDLDAALDRGLKASPIHEVLVEKAVLGWKEFELELLRDMNDNVVIICTVENLDPMGVHTGDSITVAPAMTLSDTAFQDMRNKAILMMRSLGNFAGGCNVQFALNPETEQIISVEINPRVSRSSALASKAEDRDTRGLISTEMICSVSGFRANCTLQPPAKFPSERIMRMALFRISWKAVSLSVIAGATVMESPVCTPMGSRFSTVQMMTTLSFISLKSSSSYSFQPSTAFSTSTSWMGEAFKPLSSAACRSSLL